MPFDIMIDAKNCDNRVRNLSQILGASHSSSSVGDKLLTIDFEKGHCRVESLSTQTAHLQIQQSATANFEQCKELIDKLRSIFPEMKLKSELMQRILDKSEYYEFVACRGFAATSRTAMAPQQLEFLLTNSQDESETVIAQDSADPARKQVVFIQSWTIDAFVRDLVEPWLIGERVKLDMGEVSLPFFPKPSPPRHALSESGQKWLPLPCMVYLQNWGAQSQYVLDKNYTIVESKRTYANILHAYAVLFARSTDQLQFNCSFYLPEHRGRILRIMVEPKDTKYEAIVQVDDPLVTKLTLKVSCETGHGEPKIFQEDAQHGEMKFEIESFPKEVRADLLALPDLVDRVIWRPREVGPVVTSTATTPSVVITTEIGLPVRNDVLLGTRTMVPAYARFFIMENTLRAVVKDKLVKKFSVNWVKTVEPVLLRGKSGGEQSRIKDVIQKTPDQVLDEVYYRDLKAVIDSFWSEFQAIFLDKDRTLMKLTELEDLRNDIAHNRVLPDHEIKRIEVYYVDLLSRV
jgi:hypothetical protein